MAEVAGSNPASPTTCTCSSTTEDSSVGAGRCSKSSCTPLYTAASARATVPAKRFFRFAKAALGFHLPCVRHRQKSPQQHWSRHRYVESLLPLARRFRRRALLGILRYHQGTRATGLRANRPSLSPALRMSGTLGMHRLPSDAGRYVRAVGLHTSLKCSSSSAPAAHFSCI